MKPLLSRFILPIVLLAGLATARGAAALPTKEAVLQNLARGVVAPAYAELDLTCGALADATETLHMRADAEALERARTCWIEAARCARRIECFRVGPVVNDGYAPAFYFCPIRPASIERVVGGAEPLSASRVEELGAAAKGLCAVEYLLFQPMDSDEIPALSSGGRGERQRLYLRLVARELAGQAGRLAGDWREPTGEATTQFVGGGQESLNRIVNQLAWGLEAFNEARLRPLALAEAGEETMGTASGQTRRLLLASMEGVRTVYAGGEGPGLDDRLRHLGSPAAERMDAQLSEALTALAELDRASTMASEDAVERARTAYAACHAVELLVKVDVASALGVTLLFSPIDGD